MWRWQQLVRWPEAELARLEVAAMHLACADGLPGSEKIAAPFEWPGDRGAGPAATSGGQECQGGPLRAVARAITFPSSTR